MSEMPAREQMISAYSELVGLDPVRGRARGAPGAPARGPPPAPPRRGRGPRGGG
ncbi:hypothetical protein I5K75_00005, partial [Pseudomonas aeruginosa]|nr:hypothetical protein [Pseudomonas aeruginosa]